MQQRTGIKIGRICPSTTSELLKHESRGALGPIDKV